MFNLAGKLLAFILIVQICTSQQSEQSSLLRCLTGYKDSNGKLSDCPPDRVFSKCVSSCPKTCQNPYIKSDNKECLYNCLSGCVCANGTLIDEGRNRKCVPQDECTCLHHGKIFMPNEILLRNGKKCQCKNGGWICHDQPVSSRTCAVVGLTHLETFDGALLTIKPGNYLLVKSIDDTRTNFRIEASVQKNFKRQLKFTIGSNTVILSDIHTIKLNDNKLEQLPHQTTDLTIRQATSHFILIESKDLHIAYDGNAVYITLESFYRDRVRGLCGSFDYNQDNDLRLPNGKLNYDTHLFSRSYLLNDTKTDGTLEENDSKKFDRPKAENYCHQIKNNVCKIGANAHGLLLSCIEDQRFIQTNENIRASCYWHSIFAHACAFLGYDLPQKYTKWRGECESVFGKCGSGTIYEECPLSCLNSCSDRDDEHELNSVCRQQCLAGCVCTKNNYYDTNQNRHEPLKCKKESECSCFDEQKKAYHKPGSIIKRGECSTCICLRGQFECNSHKCNQSKIICPDNLIFTETSLISCPKTCSNHLTWKNCHKYRSGCDCPTDMIRDEHTNRCVFPKHCSCEFNQEIYPYGSKVTQDCNQCTCASGQWSCTKLDCSRTCSILRNKHYTTFNGQNLKINSGSCEYTAAQFRNDAEKFALTLSDSVSNEHAHSLKGHLIIDGTHISLESGKHIRVNDKALTTLASSPARYSSFTIYKAGLFVVINGTHFILRWDFGNRIYLTIDCRWKGKLDGVCSEHVHPNKGLILRKKKDVNVWKVNRKCKVEINKRTDGNEKWRWSHEQCVGILNGTSSTKHPFSSCLNKLSKERRKTLYKECMEETCSCAIDSHDCTSICSWFASLSELCRKQGHPIEYWRNDAFCPLTCEENEEYKSCGTLCQKTCNDLDGRSMIKCYNDTCNEGCYCKEGYVLNHNGDCVKPRQCSEKTTKRPSSTTHLPSRSVTTSTRSSTKKPSNFTSDTSKTTPKSNSSYTVPSGVSSTTPASSKTTTLVTCTETELVETLVRSNLIQIRPIDLPNKQDLITKGLNFNSNFPSIEIDLPKRGAIVRDIKLLSNSIVEIEVIFVIESGLKTSPIRGSPIALPNDEFPTEKILDITINIIKTTNDDLPENVTLSVIVCGEDLPSTPTATTAISSTSATTVGATGSSTSPTQLEITQVSGATQLTDITTGSETVIDTLQTTIDSITTAGGQGSTALYQTTTGGLSSTISSDTTDIQTDTTTTKASTMSTTPFQCTEEEYIEALVSTNAIRIRPNDEFDKQDLITNGLDITDETSTFKIDLPAGGLIIRDVKISSLNIIKVEIVFIPESGAEPKTIQGIPTSLPIDEFPTDRISQIIIKILQISGGSSLEQVKLSIIACEETSVTTSVHTTLSTIAKTTSELDDTSAPAATSGSTDTTEVTLSTIGSIVSSGQTKTISTEPTTTTKFCDEMEYINTLIATDSVHTTPTDIPNKQDLITKGVNFTDKTPTFQIDIPNGGAVVRDLSLKSNNVAQIEVIFTTESGHETTPIRGAPTSLPTSDFPTQKVREIIVKVIRTTSRHAPQDVTLSVIACAEGTLMTTTVGAPGPSSSEETSTPGTSKPSSSPDESTTEGTPGRSSPGGRTKASTQGPSSSEETSTPGTSKPSSSPDESTTEGIPGRSSPGGRTKAPTQGPSSSEETSTPGTSKPSSSPDESTTEGTPGRSSPGGRTKASTQGPSSSEETSTPGTSKPSSSPDESTTEGIPGRSSPGGRTKAPTQGPSSSEETSTPGTSKPSSSPDESTTEGTPGRSSPGGRTKAPTQGPSSSEETSTPGTSKPSSSPDESTTEGIPGRSSPGGRTKAPTQGPSSSEETSTPGTSKPSSSPDESTTEGTPGRSSPGGRTKAPTQGPSSSEETLTPGTSKPSSSPDESTTEGTPGRSSPGGRTKAPTQGPSSSEETSTPGTSKPSSSPSPDESTTEGTPGRSSPGGRTKAPTQGPSSSEETSTPGTSKPSSSPDESTTEGTPGRSSPGGRTKAPTQGPSSSEETSTAGTSKPSSSPSPDESTTEGTPGRSSPGGRTKAPTQGPSSSEETSTPGTSKPSSSPDESTTEGTPGRSSPGGRTKAPTQGPSSSSEETSTPGTSKPSSSPSPDESTTEGIPGRSSPGGRTKAPTQGPSSSEETSTPGTSKPSSSPDESTTEGTPGRSSPGGRTKAPTQGPSSSEETSTPGTSKSSSSPDESTTEGIPGRSSPGGRTKAPTQGPSSSEETSTPGTSKPSSSPDESTTEGTPGRSSPGGRTKASTQGPSSSEETSTPGTSKSSSSPDESTTEGTPGRSSPGGRTKAPTQGPSSSEETSTPGTSKPSSSPSPDESTTEGTPGRSSPGGRTKAPTQGPSSSEETSTAGTSKPSSSPSPDESTTEGTPGRSSPGGRTKAPTQGPSSSEETSTAGTSKPSSSPSPDESTTEGTPGRSSPGGRTKAPTQGPSSSEETSTPGTSKPSSSPEESTSAGTTGPSSPEEISTAGTPGPSSPGKSTTGCTPKSSPTSEGTEVTGETTTAGSGSTCIEVELVETLLTANLIQITPNVTKKEDLADVGIDFSEDQPVFEIELPDDGAVVRDVKLPSKNVVKIEVSFVHASGGLPKVIRGSPTSLPKNDFPLEKVQKIIIKVLKTSNGQSPQHVKLSVIACSETLSTTTNAPTDETASSTTHTVVTSPEEKCTDIQDVIPLGSTVFATVFINGESVTPPVIPTSLVVTELPFVIKVGFKEIATLHEVSVLNPSDSKVSSIKIATNLIDDVFSTDTNAPKVTFENDIDYVTDLTITIVSTQDNEAPQKPVQLSILACLQPPHYFTKGHVDKSTRTTTRASTISSQSTRSSSLTKTTTTPSYTCEDEIALIPEQLNTDQNSLTPRFFVKPLTPYIPTNLNPGETGISFPASDKAYIIIFPIPSAAIIKSVRLPKTTNVDQIRVMCLDEQDKPIPAEPSDNLPLQITSTIENSPNINVNFPTKVNAVHITLIHTSDNQPPQGVTVEIIICVEPSNTTQQSTVTTSQNTVTTSKTATIPPSNYTSSTPSSPSPCKPKQSPAARITIGGCISQQEIQQESCAGYCPSYEEIDPVSGDISDKECLCCAPDSTYTEPIVMDCPNPTTGQNEQQTSSIIRIRSCKCSMCLGAPKTSYSNDKTTDETTDKTNHSKTKTRRR